MREREARGIERKRQEREEATMALTLARKPRPAIVLRAVDLRKHPERDMRRYERVGREMQGDTSESLSYLRPCKGLRPSQARHARLAGIAGGEDEVSWTEREGLCRGGGGAPLNRDLPLPCVITIRTLRYSRRRGCRSGWHSLYHRRVRPNRQVHQLLHRETEQAANSEQSCDIAVCFSA